MSKDEPSSAEDTAKRRDDAIRRALRTPAKPNKNYLGKSAPPPRREPKGSNRKS